MVTVACLGLWVADLRVFVFVIYCYAGYSGLLVCCLIGCYVWLGAGVVLWLLPGGFGLLLSFCRYFGGV